MPETMTYTKLETQPILVPYGQLKPFEVPTEASSITEWSGISQNVSHIEQTSSNTDTLVYYKNYAAQDFTISPSDSQARVITTLAWYGRKVGSPPGALIVELRETSYKLERSVKIDVTTGAQENRKFYGSCQYFTRDESAGSSGWNLGYVMLRMRKVGTPPSTKMRVELWSQDRTTKLAESELISTNVLTDQFQDIYFNFPTKPSLSANTSYRFKIVYENCPAGGDEGNCVEVLIVRYGSGDARRAYYTNDCGTSWSELRGSNNDPATLYLKAGENADVYVPTSKVLASVSWSASEIGTTDAWYQKSLSNPVIVTSEKHYALVFKQDVYLGDGSNYYVVRKQSGNPYAGGFQMKSSDAGNTWSVEGLASGISSTYDLAFKILGDLATKIYENTVNLAEVGSKTPATGRLNITVRARAATGTIKLFGVAGSAQGAATTTSTSLIEIVVLAKETDIPEQTNNLTWQVWANGSGLADKYVVQRYSYFSKKDITPKDFGAAELFLAGYRLPPNSAFMINDDAGNVYSNDGTSEVTQRIGDAFNVSVRKISIINGTPTIELLKVV